MPDAYERFHRRLAELTALDAPVGFEEPVLRFMRDALAPVCDRVEVDMRGNVYGWQDGREEQAPRVMITAHSDEIGFMVTSVTRDGFLRFTLLGYPTPMVLPGQRVRVLCGEGPREGVIGVKPGHLLSGRDAFQVPDIPDLYIDIGAGSAEEVAAWGVEAGTPAVFVGPLTATLNPRRVMGKAID